MRKLNAYVFAATLSFLNSAAAQNSFSSGFNAGANAAANGMAQARADRELEMELQRLRLQARARGGADDLKRLQVIENHSDELARGLARTFRESRVKPSDRTN